MLPDLALDNAATAIEIDAVNSQMMKFSNDEIIMGREGGWR
jgi:hypothetical protein